MNQLSSVLGTMTLLTTVAGCPPDPVETVFENGIAAANAGNLDGAVEGFINGIRRMPISTEASLGLTRAVNSTQRRTIRAPFACRVPFA